MRRAGAERFVGRRSPSGPAVRVGSPRSSSDCSALIRFSRSAVSACSASSLSISSSSWASRVSFAAPQRRRSERVRRQRGARGAVAGGGDVEDVAFAGRLNRDLVEDLLAGATVAERASRSASAAACVSTRVAAVCTVRVGSPESRSRSKPQEALVVLGEGRDEYLRRRRVFLRGGRAPDPGGGHRRDHDQGEDETMGLNRPEVRGECAFAGSEGGAIGGVWRVQGLDRRPRGREARGGGYHIPPSRRSPFRRGALRNGRSNCRREARTRPGRMYGTWVVLR